MSNRIQVENNGHGEACSIGKCGVPASWTVKAPVELNMAGLKVVRELSLRLCNGCKTELQYNLGGWGQP